MQNIPNRRSGWLALILLAGAAMLVLLPGCEPSPKSAQGFRLPDGNAEQGKAAFVKLQCQTCHTVPGVELPPPSSKSPITVVLGGEVIRVRTYGDLVTSLINPSHVVSENYRKQLEGKLSPIVTLPWTRSPAP